MTIFGKDRTVACFLCGKVLKVKDTKRGKPYFQCDPCGLQVFIRRAEGIELLKDQFRAQGQTPEIMAQVRRLKALRAELGKVNDDEGFFDWGFGNPDIQATREALEGQIEKAQMDLKALGDTKRRDFQQLGSGV